MSRRPQTPKQAGARSRQSKVGRSDPLAHVNAYTTASQLLGRPVSAADLIARIATYSWVGSLFAIAQLSSLVIREGPKSEAVRQATTDQLLRLTGSDTATLQRIRDHVALHRDDTILAHEEVLAYLAHVAILYGGESEEGPAPPEIALWLLAGNDFLDHWTDPDARLLSSAEELIATGAHSLRFNNDPDRFSAIARTFQLLTTRPRRGRLANDLEWGRLQTEAFGCEFREYFESVVAPLVLKSLLWGKATGSEGLPVVSRRQLFSQTKLGQETVERLLDSLGAHREALRTAIRGRLRPDGLPQGPTALYHSPLVVTDADKFVVPLPWALDNQLRSGMWARLLGAAKTLYGARVGGDIWNSTFGDAFEEWCRAMAKAAFSEGRARGTLILPSSPGATDEIEDVAVVDGNAAVLFSAKSRFVAENVARHAQSRSELIDWYDKFFFGGATKAYRAGAIHLLSKRIDRIRGGEFEATIPRATRLIPVLLTYDSLCEDILLYRWIETRCRDLGLLQQWRVDPLTLARVDQFERLMSFCATGGRLIPLFRQRETHWRHRRLDQMLEETLPKDIPPRLPVIGRMFDEMLSGLGIRLFGKPLSTPKLT